MITSNTIVPANLWFETTYPLPVEREMVYQELDRRIGGTRLHRFGHLSIPNGNRIYGKLEYENPTGSHHVRIYPKLFRIAESKGLIVPGVTPVIEASIGNAGAAFAYCARALGFHEPAPPTVILPQDASPPRIAQLRDLGARLVFSPAGQYSAGYVRILEQLLLEDKQRLGGRVGENPHRLVAITKIVPTCRRAFANLVDESLDQLTARGEGASSFDLFVGVVGSGTSVSGIAGRLKERNSRTQAVVAEPEEAPVVRHLRDRGVNLQFDVNPQPVHGVGIYGVPPDKLNIDFDVIDTIETFSRTDWEATQRDVLAHEQIEMGRSAAAALSVALRLARERSGQQMLICVYDSNWKAQE